ncbi:hypothetical protein H3Z85_00735 [Chryseobacterium indologenes]|nr:MULTISPECIES: hypothetical protein [Bacteroidota]AZA84557.1 hypothetical protein EG342_22865 [Chryseobacterium lactis]AZB04945.1 hypothetical protein EG341_13745 [Chryseobacterium lactis]MBF6643634.1 hypothetical protein [Chryseobacterium indologenes]PNW14676.1 hypothetical protein C1637_06895 [Chryseobacterium lactis]QPQ52083.1 hypothetical protein H3Z85_00735 [Chryseobacterium indologenes]
MSESGQTGYVALTSDMYFTCSSGLAPAKMYPTQTNHGTKDKFYYLVKDDTATQQLGDFCCRWTVVIAAAIAAAGIVTGGAALVLLAAVAVAASAALCGGLAAPFRKWVGYSTLNAYGRKDAYSLTSKCQMTCIIGGTVTYAEGITSTWQAMIYTARNTGWAVLEGAMLGKLGSAGFGAFAGTATPTMSTALLNFAFLNVSARGIAVVDQVGFEGILRNGKSLSETGDEVISGLTMFEQPFIQIYQKATGSNPQPLNWQDFYYAGLSLVGQRAMAESARTNPNMAVGIYKQGAQTVNALKNGKLFERVTLEGRFGLQSLFDNPVWRALWEQAKENKRNTGQENAFTRYEANMRNNRQMTNTELRNAFSTIEREFKKLASEQGVDLPEGPIHHTNWPLQRYPEHATDPKNLYPTQSTDQHLNQIHPATTQGPHPTRDPVSPQHEKPLYEYPPRPIDDNDLD